MKLKYHSVSDFGVDHLEDIAEQTTFPWLLSNIKDNVNEEPLARGEITCVLQHNGIKVFGNTQLSLMCMCVRLDY